MPPEGSPHAAHDIRRFESAVWSLFVLSDNASLPVDCRAACRLAADYAVERLQPGAPEVQSLVEMAIEVGGAENAPARELLLGRLRALGWQGPPNALDTAPPPLAKAPPRNLVSDRQRTDALDRILTDIEARLDSKDLQIPNRDDLRRRVAELRAGPGDIRSQTERAWQLLEALERNLRPPAAEPEGEE